MWQCLGISNDTHTLQFTLQRSLWVMASGKGLDDEPTYYWFFLITCTFPPVIKVTKETMIVGTFCSRDMTKQLFYCLYCRYRTLRKPTEPESSGLPPLSHLLLHFIHRTALWCHQSLLLGHFARKWVRFTWLAIRWKGAWPHRQGQPLMSQILIDSQLPPPLGFDISDSTSG